MVEVLRRKGEVSGGGRLVGGEVSGGGGVSGGGRLVGGRGGSSASPHSCSPRDSGGRSSAEEGVMLVGGGEVSGGE